MVSALKQADVKYLDSKGHEIKLSEKIRKLRGNPAFTADYARKRITLELIDNIEIWKRERDQLIHGLANIPYDHESIKEIAERGQKLASELDNNSVNKYYDKKREKHTD